MKKCPHGFCGNLADVCELCRMEKEIAQLRALLAKHQAAMNPSERLVLKLRAQVQHATELLRKQHDDALVLVQHNMQQAEALRVAKKELCYWDKWCQFQRKETKEALATIDSLSHAPNVKGEL